MAGNMFFRVVDDIQWAFINEIRYAIDEAVGLGIEYELPKVFDQMMVKTQGKSLLYQNIGLDYQMAKDPVVSEKNIQIGMKGQFYVDEEKEVKD